MPPCSVQPRENKAAHVKAEAARTAFLTSFMAFSVFEEYHPILQH
jgi:hypothetical protein